MAKCRRKRTPRTVLKLPDLEHSKAAVGGFTWRLFSIPFGIYLGVTSKCYQSAWCAPLIALFSLRPPGPTG